MVFFVFGSPLFVVLDRFLPDTAATTGAARAGSTTAFSLTDGGSSGFREVSAGFIVVGGASCPDVWEGVEVGCGEVVLFAGGGTAPGGGGWGYS